MAASVRQAVKLRTHKRESSCKREILTVTLNITAQGNPIIPQVSLNGCVGRVLSWNSDVKRYEVQWHALPHRPLLSDGVTMSCQGYHVLVLMDISMQVAVDRVKAAPHGLYVRRENLFKWLGSVNRTVTSLPLGRMAFSCYQPKF